MDVDDPAVVRGIVACDNIEQQEQTEADQQKVNKRVS
jgi:hypothetical protein